MLAAMTATEAHVRHVGVVGAGIVGLAVARQLQLSLPGVGVTIWDKEDAVGVHQTGHNSGVVHAGVYYAPGSLKARLCRRGGPMLREFCAEHGIAVHERGKLVVAASVEEEAGLAAILERARRNGVPDVRLVDARELTDIEPFAAGVAAVHSPHTAVVDFRAVAVALAEDVVAAGGEVKLGTAVAGFSRRGGEVEVRVGGEAMKVDRLVVCAGLGTDRVAPPGRNGVRIVPFRGEYHALSDRVQDRVKGLIYPVPDPRSPWLGVHFTRTHDDQVLVGPNAVPALAREGYRRWDVDPRLLVSLMAWPGGRALARQHWRIGLRELQSSFLKASFAAAARRYLPSLRTHDLVSAPAGVRAQAVGRNGRLVDDFVLDGEGPVIVVRNAPSPAATSSLAIAEHLTRRLLAS
jgi:(S)-2-hydroxyglutarate dehydrogenase